MTTWIGQVGSMVPTMCASDLPVEAEDRWMTGGGAGTLAPRRHLMLTQYGAGARTWQFSRGVCATDDAASVQSLARAQARTGGSWRFVPCGAVHTNMATPGASEELAGWSGTLSPAGMGRIDEPQVKRTRVRSDGTILHPGDILSPTDVLYGPGWVWQGTIVEREQYGTIVTATGTVSSPMVPLLGDGPWTVTDGIHVRAGTASVQVAIDALNAAGAVIATQVITTVAANSVPVPTRVLGSWQIEAPGAAAHRLRCVSTSTYSLARASLAQTNVPSPWRPGQAADAVVLRGVGVTPILETEQTALSSVSYIAEETGV